MQAVFDGHNDVLYRLWNNAAKGADPVAEFIEGTKQGHIDMPRAQKGGLVGGLCAIYIPSGHLVFDEPRRKWPLRHAAVQAARSRAVARDRPETWPRSPSA
jgi:microsomal dipeptidase-like Zn-dependent dipeptidase